MKRILVAAFFLAGFGFAFSQEKQEENSKNLHFLSRLFFIFYPVFRLCGCLSAHQLLKSLIKTFTQSKVTRNTTSAAFTYLQESVKSKHLNHSALLG